MSGNPWTDKRGYLWGVVAIAFAALIQPSMDAWIQGPYVLLYFVPWVILVAYAWGSGPSLAATLLAGAASGYLMRFEYDANPGRAALGTLVFLMSCGSVSALVGSHRRTRDRDEADRIARQAALAQLLERERSLRAMLENTFDTALIVLDRNRIVREWNVGATQLTGWSKAEVLGKSIDGLFSPEDQQNGEPSREQLLAEATGKAPLPRTLLKKGGVAFHVQGTVRPIPDERGGASGFIIAFVEVSQKVESQKYVESVVNFQAAALGDVMWSMAHDMRQYTRGMVVNAGMLMADLNETVGEEQRDLLYRFQVNAKLLQGMVDGIITFMRLGRAELNTRALDLSEMARALAADPRKKIGGRIQLSTQPDLWLKADPDLMRELLYSLLSNAAKYAPGEVQLGYDRESGAYFVKDSGIGFNPEYRETIFKPFARLQGQDEENPGLGLTNARRIVERHGGKLWAESDGEGKGATFYFTLETRKEAPAIAMR